MNSFKYNHVHSNTPTNDSTSKNKFRMQNRPLKRFYTFLFVDCLYVAIRTEYEKKTIQYISRSLRYVLRKKEGIFEMYSVPTALYIFYLSSFFLYIKIHIGEAKQCKKKEHLYFKMRMVHGNTSPRQ